MAAAMRPVAEPSRRYEQNNSRSLAVHRAATEMRSVGMPADSSWSRAACQPSKYQWSGRSAMKNQRASCAGEKPAPSNRMRTSGPTSYRSAPIDGPMAATRSAGRLPS